MHNKDQEEDKPCIYFAIGLMSGSSMDGLDVAYCTFQKKHISPNKWDHAIIFGETFPYPQELLEKIRQASLLTAYEFCKLDRDLGTWMGLKVKEFVERHQLQKVDIVGSHGHTLFHSPQDQLSVQIGNPASLAAASNLSVVGEFRQLDVSLGGQGAPLVPVGDRLLYEKYSFCLNLGGIANITYTDPNNQKLLIAHDICVCNQLLNYLSLPQEYDRDGELASQGQVHNGLLERLNQLDFHQLPTPKSLNNQYLHENILPLLAEFQELTLESKLRTVVESIATQIALVIEKTQQDVCKIEQLFNSIYMPKFQENPITHELSSTNHNLERMKLLASGGGAYNKCLMNVLKEKLNKLGVDVEMIPNETKFKEAIVFAFLAVLRLRKQINVLKSVTGASHSSSSGGIFYNFNAKQE